ncbi:farnesol dehydrogenase [Halyomorpha halys]|uniref:farnesol dehydrogenase n=1 Tax=Halyomorpha halys TaxID=286706 RepID=UPI0006D4F012|nr:farnesol dehydrogenase-like [Halyomorpha halys]
MDRWRNRVAVVTGASEGIGEGIVRRLAAEGMKVVALARREGMLKELEKELTEKNLYVRGHVCDVTNDEQVRTAFKWIEDNVGPASVLVNNAAVFKAPPITELEISDARAVIDTNLNGLLEVVIHGFKSIKNNGFGDGHIFNINSNMGHRIFGTVGPVYSASKHAVTVLSETLKMELKEKNSKIRVTSLSPGAVKTTMIQPFLDIRPETRCLSTEDIADALVYALSVPQNVNISEMMVEPT